MKINKRNKNQKKALKLAKKDTTDCGEATRHLGDWLADMLAANCTMKEGRRWNRLNIESTRDYDEEFSGIGVVLDGGGKLFMDLSLHSQRKMENL